MFWPWPDRSIIRRCSTARQRYFLSSGGWWQASEALIAETNPAKNRIKKVTPAVEELGQPLSAAKQFTVQLSHDVVKRFLRWCTTDLLFFCSPLKMFFFSGTENRKKGSIVLPCREPISCSLFQLSGSLANCILRFIFCPTPIDSSYSPFFRYLVSIPFLDVSMFDTRDVQGCLYLNKVAIKQTPKRSLYRWNEVIVDNSLFERSAYPLHIAN